MATQKGAFPFTGTFKKEVIGYEVNGKYYFRCKPETVKQTQATKRASEDFGMASSCGKLIRQALHQAMDLEQDSFLTNRLNKVMGKVIRADKNNQPGSKEVLPEHLKMLKEFAFNKATKTDAVLLGLTPAITCEEQITVSIPTIAKIKRTRHTTHVEIKAIAISANFAKRTFKQTVSEPVMLNVRDTIPPLELTMPRPGNEATIIILQVRAFQLTNGVMGVLSDKKYFAADIMEVLPPVVVRKLKEQQNRKPALKLIPAPAIHHQPITIAAIPQRE